MEIIRNICRPTFVWKHRRRTDMKMMKTMKRERTTMTTTTTTMTMLLLTAFYILLSIINNITTTTRTISSLSSSMTTTTRTARIQMVIPSFELYSASSFFTEAYSNVVRVVPLSRRYSSDRRRRTTTTTIATSQTGWLFLDMRVPTIIIKRNGFSSQHQHQLYQSRKNENNNMENMESNDNEDDNPNNDNNNNLPHSSSSSSIIDSQHRRLMLRTILALPSATAAVMGGVTAGAAWAASSSFTNNHNPYIVPDPIPDPALYWPLGKVAFSLLPLAGTYTRRATIETIIVPNTIYTHDQIQGIVNVNVPIRQTVIVLKNNGSGESESSSSSSSSGGSGLFIYNPIAPTPQLLQMMDNLIQKHGPVQHIVLGTVALEHKATFGVFASHYPHAIVWIQPGQWSFPLNVPIEFSTGIQQRGTKIRELKPIIQSQEPSSSSSSPTMSTTTTTTTSTNKKIQKYEYYGRLHPIPEWYNEIDYCTLGPFQFQSVGGYGETVFYHKATKTLLVTDCVVSVTNTPPPIILEDPRALLYHARDNITDTLPQIQQQQYVDGSSESFIPTDVLEKGWRRMVQFGLVFFPSQITVSTIPDAFSSAQQVPTPLRNLGKGAIPFQDTLYPWSWNKNDIDEFNFQMISQNGQLFCPPILTKLILDREPIRTLQFVDEVCTKFHDMERIIPCHLNNNIQRFTNKNNNNQKQQQQPIEVVGDGTGTSSKRLVLDDTTKSPPPPPPSLLCTEFYHAFDSLRSTSTNVRNQRPLANDLALLQKASDLLTQYGVVAPSVVCDGEPARYVGRFAK